MPKQVKDIKTFSDLLKSEKSSTAKDKSAPKRIVYVKQGKKITKFKLRKSKYLYTFKTDKPAIAKKIVDSLSNSNIQKVELKGKRVLTKKAGKK